MFGLGLINMLIGTSQTKLFMVLQSLQNTFSRDHPPITVGVSSLVLNDTKRKRKQKRCRNSNQAAERWTSPSYSGVMSVRANSTCETAQDSEIFSPPAGSILLFADPKFESRASSFTSYFEVRYTKKMFIPRNQFSP